MIDQIYHPNQRGASDFIWQWGQFLDHDLDLTTTAQPAEPFNIEIPLGDPHFDPKSTGGATMALNRSAYNDVVACASRPTASPPI
jgi:peroxidase